jgi:hypothetical protein
MVFLSAVIEIEFKYIENWLVMHKKVKIWSLIALYAILQQANVPPLPSFSCSRSV